MTREHSGPRALFDALSLKRKVRARWVVATLLLILGALAVRLTMLDDSWLRLVLAGGDRIGLLAKERHIRVEAGSPEPTPPAIVALVPAPVVAPVSQPSPTPAFTAPPQPREAKPRQHRVE